jgi:hypothetical protein
MNKESLHQPIRDLLETLNEQVGTVLDIKGKIPLLEMDMVRESCRKLYELLDQLGKSPENPVPPARFSAPKKTDPPAPKAAKAAEPDLFTREDTPFAIRLKEARGVDSPHAEPPEKTLRSMISINEKFIFINELFDGNLREYNESVETLNGFKNLSGALEYLDLLRNRNLWESDSRAMLLLKEMLEKRFS